MHIYSCSYISCVHASTHALIFLTEIIWKSVCVKYSWRKMYLTHTHTCLNWFLFVLLLLLPLLLSGSSVSSLIRCVSAVTTSEFSLVTHIPTYVRMYVCMYMDHLYSHTYVCVFVVVFLVVGCNFPICGCILPRNTTAFMHWLTEK